MCNPQILKRNLGFALATVCMFAISWNSMAVAADLPADLPAFGDAGGLRHSVEPGATDALLNAVLSQQLTQRVTQQPRVLAVHHGASSSRAA